MDADLQEKIVAAVFGIQPKHRLPHAERGRNGAVRAREGRHHGVADGLDDSSRLGGYDLVKNAEMRPHQIESGKISDALVKCCRAPQVGEEESQAGDLQALVDV